MRAAERAAWRAVALGGEGAAGEVRLPQADGSNGAEEKRKRRQKRLSFSLELIEHYGKKSLFCKRPPNPLCGARNAARARDLCSGKTEATLFFVSGRIKPCPSWVTKVTHTTLVPRITRVVFHGIAVARCCREQLQADSFNEQ